MIELLSYILTSIDWHEEHGGDVDTLDVEELYWVDGCHRKGGGLFVCVVKLVKMLKIYHETLMCISEYMPCRGMACGISYEASMSHNPEIYK